MTKVYDSANVSRLEPSREQLCQAKEFRERQRRNGYLIIYSMEKNVAELVSMEPAVLKREGIQQKRMTSEDKASFLKLRDVMTMQMERVWLRTGLAKAMADPKHKRLQGNCVETFDECLRLFPGSRFVERRQGKFLDLTATGSLPVNES